MAACRHESLEHIGEQTTDDGVNSYYTCKACGMLLVLTPSKNVVGVPGVDAEHKSE